MAARCPSRAIRLVSSRTSSLFSSSLPSSSASKLKGILPSSKPSRFSFTDLRSSRPLLAGAQSLMPLHSVTSSALFTSLLSNTSTWGCLSEEVKEEAKEEAQTDDRDELHFNKEMGEVGGPRGLEPIRYDDWEINGRCYDF